MAAHGDRSDRRLWLSCAALCLAASVHLLTLPAWVSGLVVVALLVRLGGAFNTRPRLRRVLLVVLVLLVTIALLARFRTLNGLPAGTALLVAMAALKVLESTRARDYAVLVFISYFLCLASLLAEPSAFRLLHALATVWLATMALLETQRPVDASALASARVGARLLVVGLPLTLVLFLFVPRLEGHFWALPSGAEQGSSGIAEEMNPGAIARLAQSEEPAFRVRFDGTVPARSDRYWRVLALDTFDGATWRRAPVNALETSVRADSAAPGIAYTISLEPTHQTWLPTLERALDWQGIAARVDADGALVAIDTTDGQPLHLDALTTYTVRSDTRASLSSGALAAATLRRSLYLPPTAAPRAVALAAELKSRYPEPRALIRAVLARFHDDPYGYTLEPPPPVGDPVDSFLFDTRSGFCEHYASGFTVLMRAAGLPARVVVGYQGGDRNAYGGYLLVRQSAAHAWSEVWLDGAGWTRVDPTAAIAPERIRDGLEAALPERRSQSYLYRFRWAAEAREALDAVKAGWNRVVVGYSSRQQERLLEHLGWMGSPITGLAVLLAGGFIGLGLVLQSIDWWRTSRRPRDRVAAGWAAVGARLARSGLARGVAEGPFDYARRVGASRPALAAPLEELARLYVRARYEAGAKRSDEDAFLRAVTRFRPRRVRPSERGVER